MYYTFVVENIYPPSNNIKYDYIVMNENDDSNITINCQVIYVMDYSWIYRNKKNNFQVNKTEVEIETGKNTI